METLFDIPIMAFKDQDEWRNWLSENHTNESGVWIKIAKKATGIPTVDHAQALDEALCYGWIDGQRRGHDESYFLQKFTPRQKQSLWSKVNIGKVETLIADGRMQKPGYREIKKAKADGRWDAAYESQANATIPSDLAEAFQLHPAIKTRFDTMTRAKQYSYLHKLMTARTTAVRTVRLAKIIADLHQ